VALTYTGPECVVPCVDYREFSLAKIAELIADVEAKTGLTGEQGVFTGTRSC
jgi:hypothetical protein